MASYTVGLLRPFASRLSFEGAVRREDVEQFGVTTSNGLTATFGVW